MCWRLIIIFFICSKTVYVSEREIEYEIIYGNDRYSGILTSDKSDSEQIFEQLCEKHNLQIFGRYFVNRKYFKRAYRFLTRSNKCNFILKYCCYDNFPQIIPVAAEFEYLLEKKNISNWCKEPPAQIMKYNAEFARDEYVGSITDKISLRSLIKIHNKNYNSIIKFFNCRAYFESSNKNKSLTYKITSGYVNLLNIIIGLKEFNANFVDQEVYLKVVKQVGEIQ